MGAYWRVGAYTRQRFWGAISIILCLGWALIRGRALIRGWALIRGLRLFEALRQYIFPLSKPPRNLTRSDYCEQIRFSRPFLITKRQRKSQIRYQNIFLPFSTIFICRRRSTRQRSSDSELCLRHFRVLSQNRCNLKKFRSFNYLI